MTLSYETIFSYFLGSISDVEFASLNMSDAYEMMSEWLHKGLSNSYIRRLFKELILDDEIQTLTYEMDYVVDDETDKDFVIGVLSKSMVVEWLKPQVRNKLSVAQMFGTSESNYFSQSAHLKETRALLEDTELELRKEIRDRGYINNPYLGGVS